MSTAFTELPVAREPKFDIGVGCEVICVGDSVQKQVGWDVHDTDEETGNEVCERVPADFTGYVPAAVVLDADGAVVATMAVSPAIGDATGTFLVSLDKDDVTEALKAAAVRWKLTIEAGDQRTTLVLARFRIS